MIPDMTPAALGVGLAGLIAAACKITHSLFLGFLHAASYAPAAVFPPPGAADDPEPDSVSDERRSRDRGTEHERLPDLPAALLAAADRIADFHARLAAGARDLDASRIDRLIDAREGSERRFLDWCARLGFREGMEVSA